MVRPKTAPKKPKRGVDFKKIKRKIGRKLPPPSNATNTQIKSKAIVLPEQSIATERAGLAVNKKGLTLRELLLQTSHHNAKIRKAALTGIKDIVAKHPEELKLHKLSIVEKLRERICDNDKSVREILYQLLKTAVFPSLKEDITTQIISLLMAYIFNAMTHMQSEIRLMAFKFFELVVFSYPSSFLLHAEKVLDNYIDILRNNQIYLVDKSKLKNALGGLCHCLSLLSNKEDKACISKCQNLNNANHGRLFTYKEDIHPHDASKGSSTVHKKLEDLLPTLVSSFLESTSLTRAEAVIDVQSLDCMLSTLQCITLAVTEIKTHYMISGVHRASLSGADLKWNNMLACIRKLWEAFPVSQMYQFAAEQEEGKYFILDVKIAEIFLHLTDLIGDCTFLSEKFLAFMESLLMEKVKRNASFNKFQLGTSISSIIKFIPRLLAQDMGKWNARLLKAFTSSFTNCKIDSKLIILYLSVIEEMLFTGTSPSLACELNNQDLLDYQITWVQELPRIMLHLGEKHPSITLEVLKFLLRVGQFTLPSSSLALEYDSLQFPLQEFYSIKTTEGPICYGPFLKLPNDCKELAICCLFYFSSLSSDFLESLASCCLHKTMEPNILIRVVEVLHASYKAGRVLISDHISFLVTLVARSTFISEKFAVKDRYPKVPTQETYWSLTVAICSCLRQMGDNRVILKLLCKSIFSEMSLKPSPENMHGLLRLILSLDTKPTSLSEADASCLGQRLSFYMLESAFKLPESYDVAIQSNQIEKFCYHLQPSISILYGNGRLLRYVLTFLSSFLLDETLLYPNNEGLKYAPDLANRIHAVASIIVLMHNDVKLQRSHSSSKEAIKNILDNIESLMDSSRHDRTIEERQRIQVSIDKLKGLNLKS